MQRQNTTGPPPAARSPGIQSTLPVIVLLAVVIGGVAVPLSAHLVRRERALRIQGLAGRAEIVLSAASTLAASHFLDRNLVELALLPRLAGSLEEAVFMTITGPAAIAWNRDETILDILAPVAGDRSGEADGAGAGHGVDFVWATDDPDIDAKLVHGSFSLRNAGTVQINDGVSPLLPALAERLNRDCRERISELASESDRLAAEALELVLVGAAGSAQLLDLSQQASVIHTLIAGTLETIGAVTESVPSLEARDLAPFYTFYRPILYRQRGGSSCFRGVVRLGVSTQSLRQELVLQTRAILVRTGLWALAALLLGAVAAVLLGRRWGQ